MSTGTNALPVPEYDREKFRAFSHFFIPGRDPYVEFFFEPMRTSIAPAFSNLMKAFERNVSAVVSTASLPFRIVSTNYSHQLFDHFFMAERIRALKSEFEQKSEEERLTMARDIAVQKFHDAMRSEEEIHQGGLAILSDLEGLLIEEEMISAVAELMRQSEAQTWGLLEVLANDLFLGLVNDKPELSEALLRDERTKKRFQLRDIAPSLSSYGYDLSRHMGDVLGELIKIDDVTTLRIVYEVLFPASSALLNNLRQEELWKLYQRRNLILHRRGIIDEMYLKNTGDDLVIGSELTISPEQFEKDLLFVVKIGLAMLSSPPM